MIALQKESLLRVAAVQARTGLSRSHLYRLVREKQFPAPLPLVGRTRAWTESDVSNWIAERIAAGRNAAEQSSRNSKSIGAQAKDHKVSQPVSGKPRAP